MKFNLKSQFDPTGDQPQAIEKLVANFESSAKFQTLLGVTGSGKTFSMANVIAEINQPTLVISHNKTLAAQLYEEFRDFFPENAVHYFVSYYDYYQPEAYIPQSDTYIEKDAKINEIIDAMRHATTASILTRSDVIIIASVSCIYGIGDPEEYQKVSTTLTVGMRIARRDLLRRLVLLQYTRNPLDPRQGHFRTRESTIEIHLPSGENAILVELEKNVITNITVKKTSTGSEDRQKVSEFNLFPAKHFVTPQDKLALAIQNITQELKDQLGKLRRGGKVLEEARLKQRTEFDLAMLSSVGYVNGVENYSRHLAFREEGSPPHTLIDYFRYAYPDGFLTFIDESHATLPQLRGMYNGDRARKQTLIDYGFRLPSARDNRPLTYDEFDERVGPVLYVSATPSAYELDRSKPYIVDQLIRPTGILDPEIEVRGSEHQIQDVIREVQTRVDKGERALVMALTKRLAEDIAEYLKEAGLNAEYLHSEVKTLERPETLKRLRTGEHDVLVGINLLREGLDLPEVSFIAILDADKEGFLRNETTLLQIMGRAARHPKGKVILYADVVTGSMKAAINETTRRRKIQEAYNKEHGIVPQRIKKEIKASMFEGEKEADEILLSDGATADIVKSLDREMKKASKELNFELAARIRDRINKMKDSP